MTHVVVPGSSANVGSGFDCLGLALDLPFELVVSAADPSAGTASFLRCEPTHPAAVAYRAAGGDSSVGLWWRSPIPPGRGLGFSGAARVAGAACALVDAGLPVEVARVEAFDVATELEGHADNAAASAFGGFTVTAAGRVIRLLPPADVEVVAWWPDRSQETTQSRRALPDQVPFDDAVFNVARVALVVAAWSTGNLGMLAEGVRDRLHQDTRLERLPESRAVLDRWAANGALAVWLSGSGPTVAALARRSDVEQLIELVSESGRSRRVAVAEEGLRVLS